MQQVKYKFGVTMIELVVALSIIAILAAIGLPSYQTYLIESRRSDAINALQSNKLIIENYMQKNDITPTSGQVTLLEVSTAGFYDIAYIRVSDTTYRMTATAKSGTSQSGDTGCTIIKLRKESDTIFPAYCH